MNVYGLYLIIRKNKVLAKMNDDGLYQNKYLKKLI